MNGVAGTWFPFAGERAPSNSVDLQRALNHGGDQSIVSIAADWLPGADGLLIAGKTTCLGASRHVMYVEPGDAVAFYNYDKDGLDFRALHTGLATSDTKWIANHWFRVPTLLKM